ncbi:thiol:disulfide interchange protein DsbA/DsbL [Rubrivivax sp. RP6-9]|uniref:thiol:disulfide interchange protein DsbA/DsbL n=1 Tax=Rubrivivax sp. RP6-9 TaxID=3415750 RepID=UPI003CC56D75
MKRRDFSIQVAGAGLGMALTGAASAQGGPVEGQQYVRLQTPAPVSLPPGKKVEVVEFFWYECPHCNVFDPLVNAWAKKLPADVAFRHVPVGFTARHQAAQKMFYALEAMGQLEALHKKIFAAIHVQNKRLISESDMVAFVSANGVDGAKFSEMFKSFQVATQANRARQLSDAYKIDGVPAMGIQGRYFTSGALAGGHDRALAVTDFLIARARQG